MRERKRRKGRKRRRYVEKKREKGSLESEKREQGRHTELQSAREGVRKRMRLKRRQRVNKKGRELDK